MKHLLAIVLLLSVSRAVCSWAQVSAPENEVILSGVFVDRNSTILSIHYDILLGTAVQSCQIGLFLSENGGVSFYEITSDASGDVGLTKKNGRKKYFTTCRTIWTILLENLCDSSSLFLIKSLSPRTERIPRLLSREISLHFQTKVRLFLTVKQWGKVS